MVDRDIALIEKFYTAFQALNADEMNACYAEDIVFSDPVFMLLEGDQVRAMWKMLTAGSKEFSLTFGNIKQVQEEYYTCDWEAVYLFSTGRKVHNKVRAFMRIKEGQIIEHSDGFRLSSWIGQAMGWKGKLFGWAGFVKKKVQDTARKKLLSYMEKM